MPPKYHAKPRMTRAHQDDMASVDGAAGEGATDGGQFVSRVPSPVTPNLPVSHHVDRVYTERQGRGGGFTKGKIDPAKLLDNLNQERESSLVHWGNKNWPPSMKVEKLKIFWDKRGSKGCKWSSLNAPGTQSPLSHPILKLDDFPFPIIGPLG